LPLDAVRRILAPCAGDVYTLCAAACVSRVWREAAESRILWTALDFAFPLRRSLRYNVNDERLAELVKRAGTGVAGEPHLERLDVTGCLLVSARGVVAALAGANLQGKLTVLRVANTVCEAAECEAAEADDSSSVEVEDVIDNLKTFVHAPAALDVDKQLLCEQREAGRHGGSVECPRLCVDFRCDDCEKPCCDFCFEDMTRGSEEPLCKHMCDDCNSMGAWSGCIGCDEYQESFLCDDCVVLCDGCESPLCKCHARENSLYCRSCPDPKHYCYGCESEAKLVACALCEKQWCGYGEPCAEENLKSATGWAVALEARVDAAALERLQTWHARSADDQFCERCATLGRPEGELRPPSPALLPSPPPPPLPAVKSEAEVEAAAQQDVAELDRLRRYYDEELVSLDFVVEQQPVMTTRGGSRRVRFPPRTVTRLMLPRYEEAGYAKRLHALLADNQRGAALNLLRAIERSELSVGVLPPDAACYGTLAPRAEVDLAECDDIEVLVPAVAVELMDLTGEEARATTGDHDSGAVATARPPVKLET
jgi:hypothetical protein